MFRVSWRNGKTRRNSAPASLPAWYLLESGRVIMNGTAAEMKVNPDIQAAYLGGGQGADYAAVKHYRQRRRWLS